MTISRRTFVAGSALAVAGHRTSLLVAEAPVARAAGAFDPWLEIDSAALAHNVSTVSRLAGGRAIVAVVKNNAYGLGLATAGPLLEKLDGVWGFAVVRADEAHALRSAGVRKPVLLMGPASDEESEELARQNVRLAPYARADAERLKRLARRMGRAVSVHLYVDTGMHRMGLPYQEVGAWLDDAELRRAVRLEGAFTELTEDQEFDREQARRLRQLGEAARARNVSLGRLHAASSDAIARPTVETFLDVLRPGLVLYGGYPTDEMMGRGELKPAYRLKARVLRVDTLAPGEGVSYHRRFTAERPTSTATLAIGHVDGYPTGAVRGCEVLIRGRLCPVIGTVSASHTVVSLDNDQQVHIGDEAILVGPDRPELHPNTVAKRAAWSEYNMFMHLNSGLRRRVI